MIMATIRHDGGDKGEEGRKETLLYIVMLAGALIGFGVAFAKGWTSVKSIGDFVGILSAVMGLCAGLVIYGLCRIFLRR